MALKTNSDKNFWQPKTFFLNDKAGLINYLYQRQLNFYKNNLSFSDNQLVLDAGCGEGSLTGDLSKISNAVFVSCDISFNLTLHCKKKKKKSPGGRHKKSAFKTGRFGKIFVWGVIKLFPGEDKKGNFLWR